MSGAELADLITSIATNGQRDPIIVSAGPASPGLLIDGRNRWLACERAGIEPEILTETFETEEDIVSYIEDKNDLRRHLTQVEIERARDVRQARALQLRQEGKSLREIGETLGVGKDTVARDLSGVAHETPGAITGKDGKTYPAVAPPRKEEERPPDHDASAALYPREDRTSPVQTSLLISTKTQSSDQVGSTFDQAEAKAEAKKEAPKFTAPKCLHETCTRKTWDKSGYCSEHEPPTPPQTPLLEAAALMGKEVEKETKAQESRAEASASAPEGSYQHWNTPGWLLDLVREVSPIKLDPCSNQWSTVDAGYEILEVENGLNEKRYHWGQLAQGGLIYLNPPYNDPSPWVERALFVAQQGAEIMLCLPTSHSTDWWRSLARGCEGLCLMKRRVNFLREGKENGSSRHETTIFYLGKQAKKFHRIFLPQGLVMLSFSGQAQPQEAPKEEPSP